jgi:thiol-disulfide isomerase/thioredoxin
MLSRRNLIKSGLLSIGAMALPGLADVKAASSQYGIKGRIAPELKVDYWIDKNGQPTDFKLADHAGKWVFLKCFQSWCPGCHAHGFPALKKISDALSGNPGVAFAGIQTVFEGRYTNTVDKVREIQLRYDLKVPMGHDPGVEDGYPATMIDYRTGGTPWMILISPQREVVFNDFSINVERAIDYLEKVSRA